MTERQKFSVMLEGKFDDMGFYITYDVVAGSEEEAIAIALEEAKKDGNHIIGCEEVESSTVGSISESPGSVVNKTGKSFFDLDG